MNYTNQLISKSYSLLDTVNCKLRLQEIKGQTVPSVDGNKLCTAQNLPVSGLCNGDLGIDFINKLTNNVGNTNL